MFFFQYKTSVLVAIVLSAQRGAGLAAEERALLRFLGEQLWALVARRWLPDTGRATVGPFGLGGKKTRPRRALFSALARYSVRTGAALNLHATNAESATD